MKYTDENQPGYLNWAQVQELAKSGLVEFGCHTYDKHQLANEKAVLLSDSEQEVISDLEKAKQSFSQNLGFSPDILAWPYGERPGSISDEKLQELGFKFCLNTQSGVNFQPAKFMDLKRFAALDFETPEKLGRIIEGYDNLGFLFGK